MPELVALDLPAGPGFVDALRAAWDAGDAVLPLDPRLPAPGRAPLLDALRPSAVVDADGAAPASRRDARPSPGDALVVATSGTTGEPKGVVLTHAAVRGLGPGHLGPPGGRSRARTGGWPAFRWPTSAGCRW